MEAPIVPATRAFWTSAECAEWLGVDLGRLYGFCASGGLPHRRYGRAYRFPINKVLEWDERRTIVNDGAEPRPKVAKPRKTTKRTAFTPKPYTGPLAKAA